MIDWRLKERAKAGVKATIVSFFDQELPLLYEQGIFDDKVERTYQWVFERYVGE